MNEELDPRDEETLELLREAIEKEAGPSEGFVDLAMMGYDLTMTDAIVAELIEDSGAAVEASLVRGSDFEGRLLTFAAPAFRFEFEIGDETPEIAGHILPPQDGTITLEQLGGSDSRPLGTDGYFEFALMGTAPFRLRYQAPDGASVSTRWIVV